MNMTRLADIMTVPAHTVAPEAPVSAAMALLRRTRGGALVVVDGERHPVGVFCQRDAALAACRPEGARAPSVAEIMTRPPLIASPDMGVAPAYRLMLEGKARHLVVADANGRLAGIVGEGDFLHHLGFPYRDRPGAAPPSAPPPADGPAGTGAGPARNAHAFGGPARAWLFALLAVALVLATEQVIEHFARQRLLAQERNAALASLSALRARVEGEINANLFLVHGLSAVIAARPDIDQAGFSVIARALVDERHALRNIAGAPDMVISLMYPLAGNEAAIGLDYRIHPAQREAALRARDSGRSVVAGPLRLRQGGIGIIVREPVFLDARRPGGERRFWGLVSAVIDAETLYRRAGLRDFDPGLRLALRAIEDAGSPGAVFFGDPDVFLGQPVTTEVMLPGGSWRLAAAPVGGWGRADTGIGVVRLLGLLAALVAGAMAWRLARGGQALAAAAARLRALLDTIPDLVWLKNPDGVYLACNPRFEQFLGAREPDILGKTDQDFLPDDLADFSRDKDRAAIAAGGPRVEEEWVGFAGDGHRELLETIRTPVRAPGGGLLGVLGIARDITERVRAMAALEAQRRESDLLGDLLERSSQPIAVGFPDGKFERCNQAFLDLVGYSREEMGVIDWLRDLTPPRWRESESRALEELGRARLPVRYEKEYLRKGGGLVPVELHVDIVARASGDPERYFAFVTDITERKRADASLRESEARYRHLFLGNPAPMLVYERGSLRLLAVNEAFARHYGYSLEEALALRLTDLYPEGEKRAITELAARLSGLAYVGEWHQLRKDGGQIVIEARSHDLEYEGHAARAAVITDITSRKRAEMALRDQEEFFRLIAENMGDLVAVLDPEGRRLYNSPSHRVLFGDPEAMKGTDAFAEIHPDDRDRVRRAFREAARAGIGQRLEFRFLAPGGEVREMESQSGVIRGVDGRVERVVMVSRDITERKRLEDEIRKLNVELEDRVRQRTAELAAANKELETFTYSVSHDLKAPLRGIDGYSRLLLEDHGARLGEEGRQFLNNVRQGVNQMNQLIEDLLAYSRLERRGLNSQLIDLSRLVAGLLAERRQDIQARGLVVDADLRGLAVRADADGLAMALRNLIDNALKFTRDSQPPLLVIRGTPKGKSIILVIKDNGIGFDMRYHDRIFEIFQRLQRAEDYPGTGIGLAIVRKAMARMGGRVWARSAPGRGATFYLELPR
jgi:PAS domain S-box-containing protein